VGTLHASSAARNVVLLYSERVLRCWKFFRAAAASHIAWHPTHYYHLIMSAAEQVPQEHSDANKNKFQLAIQGGFQPDHQPTIDVESGTHICEVKEMIEREIGVSHRTQTLRVFGKSQILECCCRGTPFGEGHSNPPIPCTNKCKTLQDYGVHSAAVVQVSVAS
jgi:hypothetical protein